MPLATCLEPVWSTVPSGVQPIVIGATYGIFAGGLGLAYNADWAKKKVQNWAIPKVLDALAENEYDEALLRTYKDKANGYVRNVVLKLMNVSLALLWFLNFTSGAQPAIVLAMSMFFTGSFAYRYKDSMDSEKAYPLLGRVFYRFYPFINESSAFARTNKMEVNTELDHKAQRIIEVRKSDLIWSLGKFLTTMFVFLTFVGVLNLANGINTPVVGDLAILGLMGATHSKCINANLTTVFSDFQRYVSMLVLRRPMYSVDAPAFFAGHESFEAMDSNLKVAHYWHSMRAFPPYNKVLHREVFEKFRKAGKTIGQSMAMTSAAQLLVHITLLVTFEASNKNLMKTISMLTVYYLLQGGFKLVEQDGLVKAFKDRDYRRNDKTKKAVWIFYRVAFFLFEFLFYVKPMVHLFVDGYDMATMTHKAA